MLACVSVGLCILCMVVHVCVLLGLFVYAGVCPRIFMYICVRVSVSLFELVVHACACLSVFVYVCMLAFVRACLRVFVIV